MNAAIDLIIIVGVGGIGSNLFQKLARYAPLNYHIMLVDGDTVEAKNIERQCFTKNDIGKNKAECLAHKATNQLGNRFNYHPYYLDTKFDKTKKLLETLGIVNPNQFYPYIKNLVIFGCVDNHPARRVLEKHVQHIRAKNILYIDGANEKTTGDVVSVLNKDVETGIQGTFRSSYDYNVIVDNSNDPNNSCQNELLDGNIQTLIANDKVAITMLEVFNNYLEGKECVGLWRFDSCQTIRK